MTKISALILFYFLTACAAGPLVTTCVSNPSENNFICTNQSTKASSNFVPAKVDNWVFLSAADEGSMLSACQQRLGGVKVKVCVFSSANLAFACVNEVDNSVSVLNYSDSENWIGVSAIDMQLLLNYCSSLQ